MLILLPRLHPIGVNRAGQVAPGSQWMVGAYKLPLVNRSGHLFSKRKSARLSQWGLLAKFLG